MALLVRSGVQTALPKSDCRRALLIYLVPISNKFLAHPPPFLRPLLNGYLAHLERTPLGMIGIDAVNNERLVAGNHVAVANVGPHRFDLRKKVLLESATSCLPTRGG